MTGKLVLARFSLAGNLKKLSNGGSVAMDSVMKSNSVTCFKIISGYGTIYRIIGGFLYAATSSLKRAPGRIFTSSKCFHRRSQNLIF